MSRRFIFWILIIAALALVGYLITEFTLRQSPEIFRLNKLLCLPGEKIQIEGQGFGRQQANSSLYFGSREIKSSHIDIWEDRNIRFRVPSFEGSAPISVRTSGGSSQGVLIYHRDQFPQLQSASFLPGLPYIEYVDPSSGQSGTLVTIQGYHFGINRGESRVWVNAKEGNELSFFDIPDPMDFSITGEEDYLLWENDQVKFYLPDHVKSGFLFLKTHKGFSNPVYFDVLQSPGIWENPHKEAVVLEQKILIDRIGAQGENDLYLWVPRPVSGGNQGFVELIESSHEELFQIGDVDFILLEDLGTSDRVEIERKILVYALNQKAVVDPGRISFNYNKARELYLQYTASSDLYPLQNQSMRSIAFSVVRGVNHPYNRARKCYDYVIARLEPELKQGNIDSITAIQQKSGGAESYADSLVTLMRILGIPSRKISGVLLEQDSNRNHFWVEFYLEGFGWFPVDPFLADLGSIELSGSDDDYFWGGEHSRRIAFSRGELELHSLDDRGLSKSVPQIYSQQNYYEEKVGNLSSYRSEWVVPSEIHRF